MGIEGVAGVDYGAVFAAAGGGGQGGQHHAGAAGGGGAADFGEASTGQATGQGIQGGDAACYHLGRGTDCQARGRSDAC